MPDLIDELRRAGSEFDLFQAIHLLERAFPDRRAVGTGSGSDEAVRLRSRVSLAFEPSDVVKISGGQNAHEPMELESAVLGLAGGQGPLPLVFTELFLDRARRRDLAGLEFLDIFNRRFLAFLYRSRAKHRLALHAAPLVRAPVMQLVDALSGIGLHEPRTADHPAPAVLHAAVQGAAPRSVTSFQQLVFLAFGLRVQVRSFVGNWFDLGSQDQARLSASGAVSRLGENCALGARAWDQSAAIELTTEPLSRGQFDKLLPGRSTHRGLFRLAEDHFQSHVEVRLVARLKSGEPRKTVLSASLGSRLGLSSWLSMQPPSTTPGEGLGVAPSCPAYILRP